MARKHARPAAQKRRQMMKAKLIAKARGDAKARPFSGMPLHIADRHMDAAAGSVLGLLELGLMERRK